MLSKYSIAPGVCVALIASFTVIYTLLVDAPTPLIKLIFLVGTLLLTGAEVYAIYRERNKHDREMAAINADALGRFNITYSAISNLNYLSRLDKKEIKQRNLIEIAGEILAFWMELANNAPQSGIGIPFKVLLSQDVEPSDWAAWEELNTYNAAALEKYKIRYAHKVEIACNELAKDNLEDDSLNEMRSNPKWYDVPRIAIAIESLAKQLPLTV